MCRKQIFGDAAEKHQRRFIDHESNHLQVRRRKQAARVRGEMKTKGREKPPCFQFS